MGTLGGAAGLAVVGFLLFVPTYATSECGVSKNGHTSCTNASELFLHANPGAQTLLGILALLATAIAMGSAAGARGRWLLLVSTAVWCALSLLALLSIGGFMLPKAGLAATATVRTFRR
jgi:hypothetical protein